MFARTAVATASLALAALAAFGGYAAGNAADTDILPVTSAEATDAWEAFEAQIVPEALSDSRVELIGGTDKRITAYNLVTVTHQPTGETYAFSITDKR